MSRIKYISVFLPPPAPELANIYSILAYDVSRREDVGLPTKFRFNVGHASQPIAGSMLFNRLRCWPNTNPSLGLLSTLRKHVAFIQCCFNVDHSLRRWPGIETTLSDCTDCCIVMRVRLSIPASETPDNTIHWLNADVMLGHRLRRWANIILTNTI